MKTPYADNRTISSRIHYPQPDDLPLALADLQAATQATITALRLIDLAMGQRPLIAPRAHKRCANIEFLRVPAGRCGGVLNVAQAAAVADVAAIVFNVSPGDAVGALDDKDQRPGYILALSDTSVASIAACDRARSLMRVCMHGVNQPMVLS